MHKEKLRYALIDTETNKLIWQFETFSSDVPSDFALSPTNPNVGVVIKQVEQLYPLEEAPLGSRPRPDLVPWTVASNVVIEVLEISLKSNGEVQLKELYTASPSQNYIGRIQFDSAGNFIVPNL